jgi:hypothetical protein
MYRVFDSFLAEDTWHTDHPLDRRRFFQALHQVVTDPKFNPDAMATYMRHQKDVDHDDVDDPLFGAIRRCAEDAWAVKDYLEAIANA